MKSKRRKNFRAILLKESINSEGVKSKTNLFKKSNKITPYSSFDYSKTKENKNESLNSTNKQRYETIFSLKKIGLFDKNNRGHENFEEIQFPKIDNYTNTYNKDNGIYNSIDISDKHHSALKTKRKNNKSITSVKKSLFNSFDINKSKGKNKNTFPRYIRLSKFYDHNFPSTLFSINTTTKPSIKEKSIKTQIEKDKAYNDYIYNKLKKNYNNYFDSSFIHKLKSDFMIKVIQNKNKIILNSALKFEETNKNEEFLLEEKDKVDDKDLENEKIFKNIRNYLINQYKKYIIGKEAKKFFSKKENETNFLYDINLLPNFKNNLIKTLNKDELDQINFIEHHTIRYLNIAKIKIQKNKDNLNSFEFIKEQIDNKRIEELDIELDKNYRDKYDLYDMEDYINKKKDNQSEVKIFNEKNKYYFYNSFMKLHDKMVLKNNY